MRIRAYDAADKAALLFLAERLNIGRPAWRDAEAWDVTARGWVEAAIENAGNVDHPDHPSAVFVAEDEGRVVGFVEVGRFTHFIGEVDAYIGELAVSADAVRRGAGRALMAAAEQWARERGYTRLGLHTGMANTGALAFYRATGFEAESVYLSKPL